MGQEAINWTGPGRSWRGGGWSVFHKEETALLNGPDEVMFFQTWGTPAPADAFEPAMPVPGLLRPPCKDLSCASSCVADLDGLWFECMVCGKTFLDEKFRLSTAYTKAEGEAIVRVHQKFYRDRDQDKREQRLLDFIKMKSQLTAQRAAARSARAKAASKAAAQARLVARESSAPPPPPPSRPPSRPPIYAGLIVVCRRIAKDLRRRANERASAAYREWLTKNIPLVPVLAEIDRDKCPRDAGPPRVRIVSDLKVVCSICGHSFWVYAHLGVAPRNPRCSCCRK